MLTNFNLFNILLCMPHGAKYCFRLNTKTKNKNEKLVSK